MGALVQAFFRILLLQAGPQSIPASTSLMWLALLLHFATGFLLYFITQTFVFSLFAGLLGTLIMVAVVHALLLLLRKHQRYLQTITALAACEVMLGLMLLPLPIIDRLSGGNMGVELVSLLVLLQLILVGWNVAVAAHIFKHALSVSTGPGFLYSIIYFIIAMSVSDLMSAGAAG